MYCVCVIYIKRKKKRVSIQADVPVIHFPKHILLYCLVGQTRWLKKSRKEEVASINYVAFLQNFKNLLVCLNWPELRYIDIDFEAWFLFSSYFMLFRMDLLEP